MPKWVKPSRSKYQVAQDRAHILQLLRRGYGVEQIAEHLGLPEKVVLQDYRYAIKQVAKNQLEDAKELVAAKMLEYAEIKKEAWDAWERSKGDRERKTDEESGYLEEEDNEGYEDSQGKIPPKAFKKRTQMKEGRLPSNEYLRTILDCIKAERELLGINPAQEINVHSSSIWAMLSGQLPAGETIDTVEARLEQMLRQELGSQSTSSQPQLPARVIDGVAEERR